MDRPFTLKIELDISAQRILNQVQLTNKDLEKSIEESLVKAFASFNFGEEMVTIVHEAIRNSIKSELSYGTLREKMKTAVNKVIEQKLDTKIDEILNVIDK